MTTVDDLRAEIRALRGNLELAQDWCRQEKEWKCEIAEELRVRIENRTGQAIHDDILEAIYDLKRNQR